MVDIIFRKIVCVCVCTRPFALLDDVVYLKCTSVLFVNGIFAGAVKKLRGALTARLRTLIVCFEKEIVCAITGHAETNTSANYSLCSLFCFVFLTCCCCYFLRHDVQVVSLSRADRIGTTCLARFIQIGRPFPSPVPSIHETRRCRDTNRVPIQWGND